MCSLKKPIQHSFATMILFYFGDAFSIVHCGFYFCGLKCHFHVHVMHVKNFGVERETV